MYFSKCNAYLGGAIRIQNGDFVLENCLFENNESDRLGGAINTRGNNHYAYNCAFVSNRSNATGGAIHNEGATWHFYNSTFVGNEAATDGGGIHNSAIIDSLVNCLFYDNTAMSNSPDIFSSAANINVGIHNLLEDYSSSGLTLNQDNNITGNPLLTNDYELSDMNSPAVDSCTTYNNLPATDLTSANNLSSINN